MHALRILCHPYQYPQSSISNYNRATCLLCLHACAWEGTDVHVKLVQIHCGASDIHYYTRPFHLMASYNNRQLSINCCDGVCRRDVSSPIHANSMQKSFLLYFFTF